MELKNKTVLFLGSSVTYGSAAGGVSFADIMVDVCGINCIKEAVSGTTLADIDKSSYVSRLKSVDKNTDIDLFVCQLSTNDAVRKLDISKVRAAISFILQYASENFRCPIVFYTGTYFKCCEYERMIELLYELKKEYDFYILDLFHDDDMSRISSEDYARYMNDPIHPNIFGYREWWTPKFVEFLKRI